MSTFIGICKYIRFFTKTAHSISIIWSMFSKWITGTGHWTSNWKLLNHSLTSQWLKIVFTGIHNLRKKTAIVCDDLIINLPSQKSWEWSQRFLIAWQFVKYELLVDILVCYNAYTGTWYAVFKGYIFVDK